MFIIVFFETFYYVQITRCATRDLSKITFDGEMPSGSSTAENQRQITECAATFSFEKNDDCEQSPESTVEKKPSCPNIPPLNQKYGDRDTLTITINDESKPRDLKLFETKLASNNDFLKVFLLQNKNVDQIFYYESQKTIQCIFKKYERKKGEAEAVLKFSKATEDVDLEVFNSKDTFLDWPTADFEKFLLLCKFFSCDKFMFLNIKKFQSIMENFIKRYPEIFESLEMHSGVIDMDLMDNLFHVFIPEIEESTMLVYFGCCEDDLTNVVVEFPVIIAFWDKNGQSFIYEIWVVSYKISTFSLKVLSTKYNYMGNGGCDLANNPLERKLIEDLVTFFKSVRELNGLEFKENPIKDFLKSKVICNFDQEKEKEKGKEKSLCSIGEMKYYKNNSEI